MLKMARNLLNRADISEIRHNPFLESIPNAVKKDRCGVCHSTGLVKYLECRSLDSGYAPLYMCKSCLCLYNATAEFNEMDVVEWQKRWAEDPEFYKVPTGDEFVALVDRAAPTFEWLENDLGVRFSGSYMEIGAGSGIMAASALRFFSDVYVLDHVHDRLLKVREIVGERYHVIDYDDGLNIKVDTVLIWHAMEHFLNPGGVFAFGAGQLKKKGYFLMQVPVLTEEHVYPGHYYFYNELVFKRLAEQNGLSILNFYYDHAMNAMTAVLRKN